MRFQYIAEHIYAQPWLITARGHASVKKVFEARLSRVAKAAGAVESEIEDPMGFARPEACIDSSNIGHICIKGVIGQHLSGIEKTCGNTDVCDIQSECDDLIAKGAQGILLKIDSPGGTVTGIPELAAYLARIDSQIPVYAFTDTKAESAGYWVACGARKIFATGSSMLGSIGVYFPWIDASGQWQQDGIKADPIVNAEGIYKAAGFGPSLSDDQRESIQQHVDKVFQLFSGFVESRRPVVDLESMRGQSFLGFDAKNNGIIDTVGTCADACAALKKEIENPEIPGTEGIFLD
jgi:signal peptide peptidase SppA